MALFSRRKRDESTPGESPETSDTEAVAAAEPTAEASAEPTAESAAESVPQVGISLSTFGAGPTSARPLPDSTPEQAPPAPASGAEASAPTGGPDVVVGPPVRRARPAAAAPAQTQAVPGMPDNVVLQAALAALPEKPQNLDVMNIMRQALQGRLYARAQGDAQALLAEGQGINLAITTHNDKRFLLVFTGGSSLQASVRAENAPSTSVVGQEARLLLRTAVDAGYDGLYIDHATPGARLVLPIELVRKALEESEPTFEIKGLLAAERGDATPLAVAEALTRLGVWVAGGTDAAGNMGLAEAHGLDGARRLEIYSHPLEVLAMGRGDRPLPLTPEQLGKLLASETRLVGVVVDGAGPWIELDRDALAPVIALAG